MRGGSSVPGCTRLHAEHQCLMAMTGQAGWCPALKSRYRGKGNGQPLFYRSTRAVRLTEQDQRYYAQVREAVELLIRPYHHRRRT